MPHLESAVAGVDCWDPETEFETYTGFTLSADLDVSGVELLLGPGAPEGEALPFPSMVSGTQAYCPGLPLGG